jgi:hypothetical protein
VGYALGERWETLGAWFHRFDAVIVAVLAVGAGWFVWSHLRAARPKK